ncbi:hypothetical protein CC78DRAFT_316628 [Lojkania enalia]|uniref:Uncharacterized protein n=1 Tax=Lojkania enalia TaxID=147567 RepID=A0A9P4N4Y2_9PLEO|nr:hypothetical protein CC78DRAFT_316628 [Didymosphaeria enalia]
MEHLSFLRYRPKDSIFHAGIRSIAVSRVERMQWINRFEKRLQMVYRLCDFDSTHAMQYLVSEMAGIVVCKAKFITSLLDWREGSHGAGGPERDSETTKLFREATSLAARSLNLIHQYSNTPYSWYTKHFREVYSSSFLAFNLASDHEWGSELTLSAWSVLDQLFPVDSTGRLVEHGLSGSVLGKVLIKARVRRDFRSGDSRSQGLQHQGMHATVRGDHPGYSATMAPHNIPTTGAGMGNFPPSANLFEDFDALMQEPLWSAGLSGVDNPFGSWV